MTAPRPPVLLEPAAVRVARCALRLDALVPGWADLVDDLRLDIVNERACIGFYVFGSYAAALRALDIADPVAWGLHPRRTVDQGGDATVEEALEDGGELTEAWTAIVRQRRAGGGR